MIYLALLLLLIFVAGMLVGAVWLVDQDWFLSLVWKKEFAEEHQALVGLHTAATEAIPQLTFRKEEQFTPERQQKINLLP